MFWEQQLSAQLPLRKIRATIRHFLKHGHPYLGQVAKKVGIPQRTLHRHLSTAGTSYTQLVNEVRFDLVTKLLEDPHVPIASIATKAGFADHSGFIHSCSGETEIETTEDFWSPVEGCASRST